MRPLCTNILQIFTELPSDENLEDYKKLFLKHQRNGYIDNQVWQLMLSYDKSVIFTLKIQYGEEVISNWYHLTGTDHWYHMKKTAKEASVTIDAPVSVRR